MKWFFLRLLPWLSAGAALFVARWQWIRPLDYPWPLLLFFCWYFFALGLMAWRRISLSEALEKLLPSVLALFVAGFGFLLMERDGEKLVLSLLFSFIPCLVLELLFLSIFDPARYPVNGLSRLNLALVPISAFYLGSTLDGLAVFLRIPAWIAPLAFAVLGGSFYYVTAHPTADAGHRRRWFSLGGGIGLHVGMLSLLLPIGMMAHGALAALFFVFPLRIRRYAYQPLPTRGHAWIEGTLAFAVFTGLLVSSTWT